MVEYDVKHWENIFAYMRATKRHFWQNGDRMAQIYAQLQDFDLENNPALKQAINRELKRLADNVNGTIVNGIQNEWTLSNNKNDKMVEMLLGGRALPEMLQDKWMGRNMSAMTAFIRRTEGGLGLSDRVWQVVKGHSVFVEYNMALGISEGTSASKLATQMKQYLNEPDRLYRRVRDKEGILRLSKAAREYTPGQGVYRSSYKNALRMTRTETNRAYQKADALRWEQQDFVLGVRVQRSAVPYECDICDAGVGDYPKDYEWDLWHPNCRCRASSILPSEEEFLKSVEAGYEGREYKFDGYVQDMPDKMKEFMNETGFTHWGHN